jgi:hypothetical protein
VFLAIFVSLIPHDIMYGPQAALIAECFPGCLRYSGLDRISARVGHRWWSGAAHRGVALGRV